MIVDKERKILFLHNPKTGGTFLRNTFIAQYGETDTIKWWNIYQEKYNTDLGHITYKMLPRFVPDWQDYRIMVMVRNPYNRFVSAWKETRSHKKFNVYDPRIITPRFDSLYNDTFKDLSGVERYCRWLKMILFYTLDWNYEKSMQTLFRMKDVRQVCLCLQSWNYYKQDLVIRNKRTPWLNPQSDFMGKDTEVLYYESPDDWQKLAEAFGLRDLADNLSVQKDYELSNEVREMIRELYFDDWKLFEKYDS